MQKNIYHRLILLFCLLSFVAVTYAQYAVTGGSGTPLLAVDDTENRLKVYLVYGIEQLEVRYSSGTSSHQWFRYKTNALNSSEPVQSTQEGTTSFIRNVEEGYGYYVKESENIGMNTFVWIIDYSKYAFDIRDLEVAESENQCEEINFRGEVTMPKLIYYTPGGREKELVRELELFYTTMKPQGQRFVPVDTMVKITGNPLFSYYESPLSDTEFTIKGDQFARHFNIEKSATTGLFQAVAVKAVGEATLLSEEGSAFFDGQDGEALSAPAQIRFLAYGNSPVAEKFDWIIYSKDGDNPTNSLVPRNMEDVTYTFLYKGTYVARLNVYGRNGSVQCVDSTYSVEIKIRESDLRIPNAFTPGTSPGINDEFKVSYKSLISFKGWIFNRWGVQLFHWTDPSKGWDGKKGGKYVPPGVYFYVIEAKGSDGINYNKKGHINIIRPKNEQEEIIE